MAPRKKAGTALAQAPTANIAEIEAEMSAGAKDLRKRIGGPTRNVIKVKPGGKFELPDGERVEELDIIVLDFTRKNFYYPGIYDPNKIVPPDCYAQNDDIDEMAPMAGVPDPQGDENGKCKGCWANAFKSAKTGRGKACKNTHELAVLIVQEDGSHNEPDAPIYMLSIAPTSLASFDAFVRNTQRLLNGYPIKAIAPIRAQEAGDTYSQCIFGQPEANPDFGTHWLRREEARALLESPPDFTPREEAAPAPRKGAPKPTPRRAGAAPSRPAGR
jgi:hypothetical protein